MVEFSCEAVWTWAFVCWKISDYIFNFRACFGSVKIFYALAATKPALSPTPQLEQPLVRTAPSLTLVTCLAGHCHLQGLDREFSRSSPAGLPRVSPFSPSPPAPGEQGAWDPPLADSSLISSSSPAACPHLLLAADSLRYPQQQILSLLCPDLRKWHQAARPKKWGVFLAPLFLLALSSC